MTVEPTGYVKDDADRIAVNCGGIIDSLANTDDARAALRNRQARLYVKDGEAYSVQIIVEGRTYTVVEGTASAKAGTMCALFIRVRSEADVAAPAAPVVKPVEPVPLVPDGP